MNYIIGIGVLMIIFGMYYLGWFLLIYNFELRIVKINNKYAVYNPNNNSYLNLENCDDFYINRESVKKYCLGSKKQCKEALYKYENFI